MLQLLLQSIVENLAMPKSDVRIFKCLSLLSVFWNISIYFIHILNLSSLIGFVFELFIETGWKNDSAKLNCYGNW